MEIEIKIPLSKEHSDIIAAISQLNAILGQPSEEVFQSDTYFQSPVRDFSKSDEALRVRRVRSENGRNTIEMTYKGAKKGDEMKIREEITIQVSDAQTTHVILARLGFLETMTVKKHRTNWYSIEEVQVSLDRVEGLGTFLEIELLVMNLIEDVGQGKERIHQIVKTLLPNWDGTEERRSYLEMLLDTGFNA
jgi:adenylate cyclase class 2